ncbi:MAG: hypothetical protein K2L46_06195, partial [Paramuribaculum sp.]|nr:hypothetical protein [Paramuribaculum sp.]
MTEEEKENEKEQTSGVGVESEVEEKHHRPWRVVAIIVCAVALLAGISFLPLEQWTNGRISNFNLLGDIIDNKADSTSSDQSEDMIDPALQEAMKDDRALDTAAVAEGETPLLAIQPSRQNGQMTLEDYTEAGQGLKKMRESLNAGGVTRIAVIGDSYIEGDIFTQDLRQMLQSEFGGTGVGYMNMHTDFPGFRRSVKQGGKGWTEFAANKSADKKYTSITQHYFKPNGNATSTYAGTDALPNLASWDCSKFLFISPSDAEIKVKVGENDWVSHKVTGSPEVQCISVDAPTSKFEIGTNGSSLIGLGTWMYGKTGVSLDCMSSRGFSGLTLNNVNVDLTRQMSKFIDYDVIILEFGINAMSSKQKDYKVYANRMIDVINHVRECYPNADIIMMSIGDRGEKKAGEVHSMGSAPYMVSAQRDAARKARCLFYDTRESMGGEDAIVSWVN